MNSKIIWLMIWVVLGTLHFTLFIAALAGGDINIISAIFLAVSIFFISTNIKAIEDEQ